MQKVLVGTPSSVSHVYTQTQVGVTTCSETEVLGSSSSTPVPVRSYTNGGQRGREGPVSLLREEKGRGTGVSRPHTTTDGVSCRPRSSMDPPLVDLTKVLTVSCFFCFSLNK